MGIRSAVWLVIALAGCGRIGFDSQEDTIPPGAAASRLVSANGDHGCAIHQGGVWCWGGNGNGELGDGTTDTHYAPVPSVGYVGAPVAVTTGFLHTCILTELGEVWCWGNHQYGQVGVISMTRNTLVVPFEHPDPNLVTGLPLNPIEIVAGGYHTCALYADGTVWCWGRDTLGELGDDNPRDAVDRPVQVAGLSDAVELAAGGESTCARKSNHTVVCWGNNGDGELGDGTKTDRAKPVPVIQLSGATAITMGSYHACAIVAGGAITCWGDGNSNQLGRPGPEALTPIPAWGAEYTAIDAGDVHSCALKPPGTVVCWGQNRNGTIGDNTTTNAETAVPVANLADARGISAGTVSTCAIRGDASVQCWGEGTRGQLGDGHGAMPSPQVVPGLATTDVQSRWRHTCTVVGQTIACWGEGESGQLGDNGVTARPSPSPVTASWGNLSAVSVATGIYHTCALVADGSVWCWGENPDGQLGDGTTARRNEPVKVTGLTAVTGIAVGEAFSCAKRNDGTVWCWGANDHLQLGATGTGSPTPMKVPGLPAIDSITVGGSHACARSGAVAYCWGNNGNGQLGVGTTADTLPIAIPAPQVKELYAGFAHTCAIELGTGALWCWGRDGEGQLGDNGSVDRTSPFAVGLSPVTTVAPGVSGTCAIVSGSLYCWGVNYFGEMGDGTYAGRGHPILTPLPFAGVSMIALGVHHTCAGFADGKLSCWGDNTHGELGLGIQARALVPRAVLLP